MSKNNLLSFLRLNVVAFWSLIEKFFATSPGCTIVSCVRIIP